MIARARIIAQDLTRDITDSDARLRNLRQTEADIRHIMDRSGSVSQIMDAENQLSQVREQIETLESDLKSTRGRVAYATIDIDLQAEASTAPVQPTFASQLVSTRHGATAALAQVTIGTWRSVCGSSPFHRTRSQQLRSHGSPTRNCANHVSAHNACL